MHVPRADLQNIRHLNDQGDLLRRHYLRHHREPGLGPRLGQQLQPLEPQALEGVRRGARLERAGPQHMSPRLPNRMGGLQQLGTGFDGAGAGNENGLLAPDEDFPYSDLRALRSVIPGR